MKVSEGYEKKKKNREIEINKTLLNHPALMPDLDVKI